MLELLKGYQSDTRSAVIYSKPRSLVDPDFVWKATDEWIVFPWSDEPPVTPAA